MKKRLLSALLTVAMMFSLFPASAFASADQTPGGGGGRFNPTDTGHRKRSC